MHTARPLEERSFTALLTQAVEARLDGLVVLRDRDGLRHGVWIERGYVVGVHVAGRFDPLLELLRGMGMLSERGHRSCLEALHAGSMRSGELAISVGGLPTRVIRDAIKRQVVARFGALIELADSSGYDAQLEAGPVPYEERSMRMPLGALLRHALREPTPAACATTRDDARRALRSLAKALHPDLHGHLDAGARARMSDELARATAAYHGLVARR